MTIDGIFRHELFNQHLWSGYDIIRVFIVTFVLGALAIKFSQQHWISILGLTIITYIVALVGAGAITTILIILLASYALGDWLFQRTKLDLHCYNNGINVILRVSVGLAIFAALIQFMVHWPVNYQVSYLSIVIGVIIWRFNTIQQLYIVIFNSISFKIPENSSSLAYAIGLLFFTVALHVIVTCKPEIGHDALAMHLWIPTYIADHHYWHFDVIRSVVSVMPMATDFSYTLANVIGGEFAARLLNLSFLLLVTLLLYAYLLPKIGTIFTTLLIASYLSTPLLGLESGSLFIENFWTLMILSAAFVAVPQNTLFKARWTVSIIFLSLAMAAKVITIFVIPVFVGLFLWQAKKEQSKLKEILSVLFSLSLIMLIIGGWPYWVALWKTGNPVFPFMNHIFKSPYFDSITPFNNPLFNQGISISSLYNITFDSSRYLESQNGAMGFLWITLLLPALIFLKRKTELLTKIGLLISIFLIIGVFSKQAYLRYLLPALPFFILLIGNYLGEMQFHSNFRKIANTTLVIIILLNAWFFSASGWYHKDLVQFDFHKYINNSAPERKFVEYLNIFDPGAKVMFIGRYYPTGLIADSAGNNWYFPKYSKKMQSPNQIVSVLNDENIDYLVSSEAALKNQPGTNNIINESFDKILNINGYFLAKMHENLTWENEMLFNNDFSKGLQGWGENGNVNFSPSQVSVSSKNTLTQSVNVISNHQYLISYTLSCQSPVTIRLQVNWSNIKGEFIGTSLTSRHCSGNNLTFSEKIKSPVDAKIGVFYVGTHDGNRAIVSSVSMKY